MDIESGELIHAIEGAHSIRGFDGGWIAALVDRVVDNTGGEWLLNDPRVTEISESMRVAISCDGGECAAYELLDGGSTSLLGGAGDGGDIWIDGERVWWGVPALNDDGAPGLVISSDGEELVGIAGDHLGRSIGGGYAVGGINWETSPRRTIMRDLNGGQSISLDGISGPSPLSLDSNETLLLIGAPGWSKDGNTGAVISIEIDNIR
jgi:hypothetical protein